MTRLSEEHLVDDVLAQLKDGWQSSWPKLAEIRREFDQDWSGDQAIRIWVVLDDNPQVKEWDRSTVQPIEDAIFTSLKENGVESWPYISFRGKQEQAELDEEAASPSADSAGEGLA